MLGQTAPADSLRRALEDVFARPEFRWVERRHPLQWLLNLWGQLGDWLDAFQSANPGLFDVFFVALLVILAGILAHAAYVVWRIVRPTARTRGPAAVAGAAPAEDARAHLQRAEDLARAGRFAEALAHRFVALLLELERGRALTFHPSKTPAEYVGEARLDTAGRASLAGLVTRLYRHLFGAVPCDERIYREFGAAAHVVLQHVTPD